MLGKESTENNPINIQLALQNILLRLERIELRLTQQSNQLEVALRNQAVLAQKLGIPVKDVEELRQAQKLKTASPVADSQHQEDKHESDKSHALDPKLS